MRSYAPGPSSQPVHRLDGWEYSVLEPVNRSSMPRGTPVHTTASSEYPWAPSCWSTQKGILLFAKILLCLVILICLNRWSNDVHYYLMYHLYVLPVHRDIDYQLALEWFLSDPHSSHPLPDHPSCCPCWERKSLQNHHGATGSNHGWLCGYNAHVTTKTQQPTNPAESQV